VSDYLRRKELDLEFQAVAARIPDEPAPPGRVQVVNHQPPRVRSERESDAGGSPG
jgi:hypothetical protein